ncbi:ATP-binding protein [Actinacidiphila bryophytorum]|uniref:ATP-binding protein n=1 Tax=Actinacidiphila bryophytorum TaxID=1436133 RepID=UPI0022485A43|nr:ATP-binding protein [Actinacidiphila bryophytorum]
METVYGRGVSAGWSFTRSAKAPGRARRLLREQMEGWGVGGEVRDVAELLVSELVTNSVRHACRPTGRLIAVGAEMDPGRLLRVEVADASDVPPVVRVGAAPEAEGGRGLVLVGALAADWGTYPRQHVGKVVWFSLGLKAL